VLKVKSKAPEPNLSTRSTPTHKVTVSLSELDYQQANIEAKKSHETLAKWISSLVNTALQP
jgi:hypothetical protein